MRVPVVALLPAQGIQYAVTANASSSHAGTGTIALIYRSAYIEVVAGTRRRLELASIAAAVAILGIPIVALLAADGIQHPISATRADPRAQAETVALIDGAANVVVVARASRRLELASGVAAIAIGPVAIVAPLAASRLDKPVAANRSGAHAGAYSVALVGRGAYVTIVTGTPASLELTSAATAVAAKSVSVVALLAAARLDHAIPAGRATSYAYPHAVALAEGGTGIAIVARRAREIEEAARAAAIAAKRISIVALLAASRLNDPVAAGRSRAGATPESIAHVPGGTRITVVARASRGLQLTGGGAAITARAVAVVALLPAARLKRAVPACRPRTETEPAPVAGIRRRTYNTVIARASRSLELASAAAAVSAYGIAVVALLPAGGIHNTVPTSRAAPQTKTGAVTLTRGGAGISVFTRGAGGFEAANGATAIAT